MVTGAIGAEGAMVTGAIGAEGGMVTEAIGDGVMGVLGLVDLPGTAPARAIRAGCAMLDTVERWSLERIQAGRGPVRIGVGVHHGPVFVGAVGTGRLEFTVLDDTVDVANRLEQHTKDLDHDLVASPTAVEASGTPPGLSWTSFPAVEATGRRAPMAVQALRERGVG